MAFRRGFKSQAEALALELRQDLGLSATDRFDPREACAHLAIPVAAIAWLARRDSEASDHLLTVDPGCFSAGTVFCGPARAIVLNDGHSPARQNSSIAHELGHVLLEHPPGNAIDPLTGCRTWSKTHEEEADWLGGCLLAPRKGLEQLVSSPTGLESVAEHLAISSEMIQYRYNATGLARQHQRRDAKRQQAR